MCRMTKPQAISILTSAFEVRADDKCSTRAFQLLPIADLGRTRLDRRRPPFHDAELSRYDAAFWAWEACVKRSSRRGPPTLLAR